MKVDRPEKKQFIFDKYSAMAIAGVVAVALYALAITNKWIVAVHTTAPPNF